jgi:PAS domain S-box-containing protein
LESITIDPEAAAKTVSGITAFVVALVAIWKRVLRPMFAQYQYAQEILSKVNLIVSELTPNGGGSIKDAINRIESRQMITESRTKALLIDSDSGMWESDENGQCVWWNRTLEGMHGREPKGMNWVASIAPEEREAVLHEWEQAVRLKREFYMNITYQDKNAIRTPCVVKAYPLLDAKRQVKGWVGVATKVKDGH